MDGWQTLQLGDFLTRSGDSVDVEDDLLYRQVTVSIKARGVRLRGESLGRDIGTKKQSRVHGGQWIMSKIDARNGAFGLVPSHLEGAIVTHDFPVFDADDDAVLANYFRLYSSQPAFWELCARASRGTTNRKRVDVAEFLRMEVAIPSIAEQRRIVDLVDSLDEEARALVARTEAMADLRTSVLAAVMNGTHRIPPSYDRWLDADSSLAATARTRR